MIDFVGVFIYCKCLQFKVNSINPTESTDNISNPKYSDKSSYSEL
jgi:hypothetical protein